MNSQVKNFTYMLRRFRTAGILNILGLTASFVGFILILIQINYEMSFDKYYPNWENIYRLRLSRAYAENKDAFVSTLFIRNIADAIIENSPQIDKATIIYPFNKNKYLQVDKGGHLTGYKETIFTCYPDITDIFEFEMVEGLRSCLNNPNNIIIPESMARRMFGNESAIGKVLYFNEHLQTKIPWRQNQATLTVGGVYKDFPANVQLDNVIYTAIDPTYAKNINDSSSNFLFYVSLTKGTDPKQLESLLMNNRELFDIEEGTEMKLIADNVSEVYFSEGENYGYKTGDKNTAKILTIIVVLIISIAAINFTNFSEAMAPRRIKSLNIRKVLGSSNTALRIGLVCEAVVISLFSFILALGIVYVVVKDNWMPFINTNISTDSYISIMIIAGVVALLTGCIVGIRPAFYMTSFAPSEALKGNVVFTSSGFKLRTILVGFQFVVAIALVSAAVLIYAQFLFMKNYRLGFDIDQVAIVELNNEIANTGKAKYIDKLKEMPEIVDVAFSAQKLGASDQYITYGSMRLNGGEETLGYMLFPVSWNFLSVMGIEPIEGRSYTEQDANSGETSLLINKATQKSTNANVGDSFTYAWSTDVPQRVIGIVDNIQFSSLRHEMGNAAFTLNDKNGHGKLPISYIKITAGADISRVVEHINKSIATIDPAYPVKIEFYDDVFNQLYQQEIKLSNSVYAFSILAIIIAAMGVLGIVVFDCESRKKEVALRKVMGATVSQILTLFNAQYARVLCVSFFIAVPVVYYFISKWLEGFAYKIPMYGWRLFVGGIIVLVITILTVSIQSYRTAMANPTKALKNE